MPLIIITAHQRAGTQALRSVLNASQHIQNCGEVFSDQPHQLSEITSFFRFRQELLARRSSLSIPTRKNTGLIWKEYTEHLRRTFPEQTSLLDVKYNSYRHLDCTWLDPLAPPRLLTILRKANARFIHIERRNKRAQALSHLVARKTGQWYFDKDMSLPDKPDLSPARIDTDQVEETALRITRQVQWFRDSLGQYEHVTDLFYEELFDDGSRLTQTAREKLEAGLRIRLPDSTAVTRKTPNFTSDWIENIDELMQFIEAAD